LILNMNEVKSHIGERSKTEIRQFLEDQGCVFHGKRKLEFPNLDGEGLEKLLNPDKKNIFSKTILPSFRDFVLEQEPITDSFSHDERRSWRDSLPPDVRMYYENTNQLKGNRISVVIGYMCLMPEIILDPSKKEEISRIVSNLLNRYHGRLEGSKPYQDLNNSEKIEFVQFLEDQIIRVLGLFPPDVASSGPV